MPSIRTIKPGNTVLRQIGDELQFAQMPLRVTAVDSNLIHCGSLDGSPGSWTFCRFSGWEIDHDLGWGPQYGGSGTRLVAVVAA